MLKGNGNEVFPYKNAAFHKKGSIEQGKGTEREEGREIEIKEEKCYRIGNILINIFAVEPEFYRIFPKS